MIAGFLLFNNCKGKESESISHSDTLFVKSKDTHHELVIEKPYPVPYMVEVPGTPGATVTIPSVIDSVAVVRDYFTKRSYLDTIRNDSVDIYLKEQVWKNELKRLSVGYKWKVPTMQINKTIIQEKQLLFIGAEPHGNKEAFGVYVSADFDTKKALFGYGYDPFTQQHKISVKGKIKLWKKR